MLVVLLTLAALFAVLLAGRLAGGRRQQLMRRWPALVLAGAALFAFARGLPWPGVVLALAAGAAWQLLPELIFRRPGTAETSAADPADAEARAILGVGAHATPAEIRATYRAKMAQAHPDRGGTHAEAARLTAARDRLLKKKR